MSEVLPVQSSTGSTSRISDRHTLRLERADSFGEACTEEPLTEAERLGADQEREPPVIEVVGRLVDRTLHHLIDRQLVRVREEQQAHRLVGEKRTLVEGALVSVVLDVYARTGPSAPTALDELELDVRQQPPAIFFDVHFSGHEAILSTDLNEVHVTCAHVYISYIIHLLELFVNIIKVLPAQPFVHHDASCNPDVEASRTT